MSQVPDPVRGFYDSLAEHYHLIFDDWDLSMERQARALNSLLASQLRPGPLRILDCACGIGTQALGFARSGHRVVASDLSPAAVARARREAGARGLEIAFQVADMTSLHGIEENAFDAVAALDNALPHLEAPGLASALEAISARLKAGGLMMTSTRDYDEAIERRSTVLEPAFYGTGRERRIVHQVWDWIDHERYTVHLYITQQTAAGWTSRHFVAQYRCITRRELGDALTRAGFVDVRWLAPAESGYYQPIVVAYQGSSLRASR